VLAYEFEGRRFDCGAKLGFLIANVEYGLMHKDLKDGFFSLSEGPGAKAKNVRPRLLKKAAFNHKRLFLLTFQFMLRT